MHNANKFKCAAANSESYEESYHWAALCTLTNAVHMFIKSCPFLL